MITDALLTFANGTAVDGAAAPTTALIGDVLPLRMLGATSAAGTGALRDIGNGEPLYLVITTDTEIITGGSAGTMNFKLVSDAQAAIATDGSATVHWQSKEFVTDDAAANSTELNVGGVIACIALPMEGAVYEDYLGILTTRTTTAVTAGAINAFLTHDPQRYKAYADGI